MNQSYHETTTTEAETLSEPVQHLDCPAVYKHNPSHNRKQIYSIHSARIRINEALGCKEVYYLLTLQEDGLVNETREYAQTSLPYQNMTKIK